MVVILTGAGKMTIGEALAAELGWRIESCDEPHALHTIVAHVLGRREHRVIASPALSADAAAMVRGGLHHVRIVDLSGYRGSTADIVGAIRREFGI